MSKAPTDPPAKWEDIDPTKAADMLESNEANRNVRARVVSAYTRDMAAGKWLQTGETVKIARGGMLLDGQHRLESIVQSGTTQRILVVRELELNTRGVIDTGATRSGGDALRLVGLGGSNPMALAGAARLFSLWNAGRLTMMNSGMRGEDRATHTEIIEVVTERPDLLDAVQDSQRDYERIGLPTGPQAMARTVLADINAKDAEIFFDSLAGYATDGQDDPRAVLLYTIRQMRALGQLRRPGESIGLTFTAWNAWRDGQKIRQLNTRDPKGRALRIPQPL